MTCSREERWSGKYAEKLAAEAAKVASKPAEGDGAEAPAPVEMPKVNPRS